MRILTREISLWESKSLLRWVQRGNKLDQIRWGETRSRLDLEASLCCPCGKLLTPRFRTVSAPGEQIMSSDSAQETLEDAAPEVRHADVIDA